MEKAHPDKKPRSFASSRPGVKTGVRFIAMEVLSAWQPGGEPLEVLLERALQRYSVDDPRDRKLAMAIVYGVLRRRNFLDEVIEKFSRHPLKKMKPATLAALRLGVYQLVFLDRVPASAAINETVEALKSKRQPSWLTGFVNGLLRTVARQKKDLPDPWSEDSLLSSHPSWLVERWLNCFGREKSVAICRANNEIPPLVLRVNSRRTSKEQLFADISGAGHAVEPGIFSEDALRIPLFPGMVEEIPGYRQGFFQVQDEAAQLATHLLGPLEPAPYLDACAGVGGKTSHLAQLLPSEGKIMAVEPDRRRLALLEENLARLGLAEKVELSSQTLKDFSRGRNERFRGILIDAPCSGLGVIRRHPEIRWTRTIQDLLNNQKKQLELLEAASSLLECDGVLVYATCSTEPEENQQVVERFLAGHPEFTVANAGDFLPAKVACLVDAQGFFRTTPDLGIDGFFAARLTRRIKM